MQAVGQRVAGELLEQGNYAGLIVYDLKLRQEPTSLLILRYAFVTRGPGRGDHIFPAFILDDWGREIHSLKLYRWVRDNGERFPRAEIFGYEQDGRETQCFLRELELYARLPCYAFHNAEQKVSDGRLVNAIFLRDASATEIQKIVRPPEVGGPLQYAHVSWWQSPVETTALDLSRLDTRADPGY